jgi:hypothetical protein
MLKMISQDGNWNTVKLMHNENSLEMAVNDILAETWAIGEYYIYFEFQH